MTLSPTSNVTSPPVRKRSMEGRNRTGSSLSIAHFVGGFNAKWQENRRFQRLLARPALGRAPTSKSSAAWRLREKCTETPKSGPNRRPGDSVRRARVGPSQRHPPALAVLAGASGKGGLEV